MAVHGSKFAEKAYVQAVAERLDHLKDSLSKSTAVGATTHDLNELETRLKTAVDSLKTDSDRLYQTKYLASKQKRETDDSIQGVENGILRQQDHFQ